MKKINLIIVVMVLAFSANAQQWPWRLQSFVPYNYATGIVSDSFEWEYSGRNGGDDSSMLFNPFDRVNPYGDWIFQAYDTMRVWDCQSTPPYLFSNSFTALRTPALVKIGSRDGASVYVGQYYAYDAYGRKQEYTIYDRTGTKIWVSKYAYNSLGQLAYNTHEGQYGSSTSYLKRDSIAYTYDAGGNPLENIRYVYISGDYYADTRELSHYIAGTSQVDTLWNYYGYTIMGQWYVQKYFTYKYGADGVTERLAFSEYDDIQERGRYEYDNGKMVGIYKDDYDTWADTFIRAYYIHQSFDTAGNRVHSLFGLWKPALGDYDTANGGGTRYNYEHFDTTRPTSVAAVATLPLTIYPNPATTQLYVQAMYKSASARVEVYNLAGQLVLLIPDSRPQNNRMVIHTETLAPGAYSIVVKDGDTRMYGTFLRQP